jgi:hypothetical protein
MWIILFSALDDFGIKELNSGVTHSDNTFAEIDAVKRKVADEALHGALRIAGLAGVLTSNGYLVSLQLILVVDVNGQSMSNFYFIRNSALTQPSCTSVVSLLEHCLLDLDVPKCQIALLGSSSIVMLMKKPVIRLTR